MANILRYCNTAPAESSGKTATGLPPNVAGMLSYALGWVTGIIFLILERDNEFVRFHALQSIIIFGGITVGMLLLGMVPVVGWILNIVIGFGAFTFWVLLMSRAYQQCSSLSRGCCYAY